MDGPSRRRRRRSVRLPTDAGREMLAELAAPPGQPRGAVIVVHELFGLTDHLRDVADRLAAEGYLALAVDLFGHRGGRLRCLLGELGRMLIGGGPADSALADLEVAAAWLRRQPSYRGLPVGIVGFCWGGGAVLALVTRPDAAVDAAAAFYGRNPPLDEVANVTCPVLAVYGAKDRFVTPSAGRLREAMTRAGRAFEAHVVPDVGHSFMNERRRHDPVAVATGWQLLLTFFGRHLTADEPS
jgi:carboxymethylenebutenolidase